MHLLFALSSYLEVARFHQTKTSLAYLQQTEDTGEYPFDPSSSAE